MVNTLLGTPCGVEGDTAARRRSLGWFAATRARAVTGASARSHGRAGKQTGARRSVRPAAAEGTEKLVGMAGVAGADDAVRERQRDHVREHKLVPVLARSGGESHPQRRRPSVTDRTTTRIDRGSQRRDLVPTRGRACVRGCTTSSRAQDSHRCVRERECAGIEATTASQDGGGATTNEKMQPARTAHARWCRQ
jgi:hypothetical protein